MNSVLGTRRMILFQLFWFKFRIHCQCASFTFWPKYKFYINNCIDKFMNYDIMYFARWFEWLPWSLQQTNCWHRNVWCKIVQNGKTLQFVYTNFFSKPFSILCYFVCVHYWRSYIWNDCTTRNHNFSYWSIDFSHNWRNNTHIFDI